METIKDKVTGKTISYREKVYINNKAHISTTFKRKMDAIAWKAKIVSERNTLSAQGISFDPSMTFEKFAQIWIDSKKSENLAQRSLDSYRSTLSKHLVPFFKTRLLSKITQTDGIQFRQHLSINTKLGSNRINFVLRVLKQIFNDALKWDYVMKGPVKNLNFIKLPDRALSYWRHPQIEQFLSANQDNEYIDLFELALNTGLRKGEILGLCWDKVDFNRSSIEISRTVDRYGLKNQTKTGKIRHVSLNRRTIEILSNRYSNRKHPSLVFTQSNGEPIKENHLNDRIFKKLVLKANVPMIRLHDLRTSYASNFVMAGGDIFVLAKILGHSSVEMTAKKYAHLSEQHMRGQAEVFSTGNLNNRTALKVLAQI